MVEKQCFKCNRVLPLDQFYVHKQMADGHLNKCIECTKADVARRYEERREQIREYERARFQTPHRKAKVALYRKRHREANPDKYNARNAVGNALRDGRIVRPTCCQRCSGGGRLEAHHHDYSKPLDVEWLCFKCHRESAHGQVVF